MSKVNPKTADVSMSQEEQVEEAVKDSQAGYKCMRNPDDGSMYYGEVAYIRKSNG